jgi:hypothetical protein
MHENFSKELNYIKDEDIKNSLIKVLDLLPDYFYEIPASSTGKYHPEFSLGDGGLVRHVKVAVRIAKELLDNPCIGDKYTKNEKDIMIFTLILHDGLKSGLQYNRYTQANHPTLIKNFVFENKDKIELTDDELDLFGKCVEAHMGPWNTDYDGNEILPKPKTKYENFVHMCDFLSSKKFLNVKFKDNEIDER